MNQENNNNSQQKQVNKQNTFDSNEPLNMQNITSNKQITPTSRNIDNFVIHLKDSNEPLDMQTITKIQNITGNKQPTPPAPPPNINKITMDNNKEPKKS
jgi:hypothetical protein